MCDPTWYGNTSWMDPMATHEGAPRGSRELWLLIAAEIWLRYQSDRTLPERLSSRWSLPQPECEFQVVERGKFALFPS